jgi:hypothetical protein
MLVPLPGVAPVTPVCTTVHANVVPVIELVKEIEVVPPEVRVCVVGVAVATGGIGSSSCEQEFRSRNDEKTNRARSLVFIKVVLKIYINLYTVNYAIASM